MPCRPDPPASPRGSLLCVPVSVQVPSARPTTLPPLAPHARWGRTPPLHHGWAQAAAVSAARVGSSRLAFLSPRSPQLSTWHTPGNQQRLVKERDTVTCLRTDGSAVQDPAHRTADLGPGDKPTHRFRHMAAKITLSTNKGHRPLASLPTLPALQQFSRRSKKSG